MTLFWTNLSVICKNTEPAIQIILSCESPNLRMNCKNAIEVFLSPSSSDYWPSAKRITSVAEIQQLTCAKQKKKSSSFYFF